LRALVVSVLILLVGLGFGAVQLINPLAFVGYVSAIAAIFAMLGIITALWAEGFEQLQSLNTFVITPLTYLGGIFYSVTMLPSLAASITQFNPFFYFADGIRNSMIGYSEANTSVGLLVIISLLVFFAVLVTRLFQKGWKIRS
jgi:ABC-2 type transport system permease protein